MTYEEALKIIGSFEPDTRIDSLDKLDALMKAMEALEKQIPKKPKTLTGEYYKTYTFECECGFYAKTNCTQSIEVRDLDYCPCCGQAIDWSEEDEQL